MSVLDPFEKALAQAGRLEPVEGPDKVMPLAEAVARFVRPGMDLHFCTTHNRPGAASLELCRAFRGRDPGFTISCIGFTASGVLPVYFGITRKLLATFTGDSYPTPGPNPIINRAWKAGRLEIENWSILSLPLRLMAGAMGLPHIPTRSLVGSSMARDNTHAYSEMTDESGETFGLLKPLNPDLAFIHAPCADRAGNVIITPPYGEDQVGAWAAKQGVIVTVDRVVSAEFVRRYSHLVKIPSYLTAAVCEAPFGAHPGGVSSRGLPEFESYADDYEFILDFRQACKTEDAIAAWVKQWIDDCPTWDDYLQHLGRPRIWSLKGKAHPDSWKSELAELAPEIPTGPEYSAVEMMVVAAGRVLAERIQENNYATILAGVGASNLAAWLGYYALRERGVDVDLMAELGFFGYAPRPADPFIFNYRNLPATKMLTGIPTIMGVFMSGAGNRCIGSIASGQVDKFGNINSTLIPGVTYLTGSGGANDICSGAREVLVTALSGPGRMVDKVAYVSSPGARVRTVVSDQGVFEKGPGAEELVLTGYFAGEGRSGDEMVREIKAQCGWDLKVAPGIQPIAPPELEELKLLRILDPRRQFLGKR